MSLRKIAGLLAVAGLTLGLIGGGIGANFTDQVTATQDISVGTFSCVITDATAGATIAVGGKSVTYTVPTVNSSAAGSAPFYFQVKNTGSINQKLMITAGGPYGSLSAKFSAVPLAPASPVLLSAGSTQNFNTGIQWTTLDNADLGGSGSFTWTVNCGEVPATQTITSSQLNFGQTGWAGWSCPTGKTIVSASILDVADAGNGLVTSLTLWKLGATVGTPWPFLTPPGPPPYNYPVTPFGYTYAVGEEGAIAQNDNDSDSMKIVLVCSL